MSDSQLHHESHRETWQADISTRRGEANITTREYPDGHTLTITDKAMVERDSLGNVTSLRMVDKNGNWTPEEDSAVTKI